jgi:hypothetical protein
MLDMRYSSWLFSCHENIFILLLPGKKEQLTNIYCGFFIISLIEQCVVEYELTCVCLEDFF